METIALDMELIRLRVRQIEQRIQEKHPKAARDGELMAFIWTLQDAVGDQS